MSGNTSASQALQSWPMPGTTTRQDGCARQVGIEFEFQGVAVGELAELTARTLGGTVTEVSSAEYVVDVDGQGSYRVEVDFALLKEMAQRQSEADGDRALERVAVGVLEMASSLVVPCEIVTPPLAMKRMSGPMRALERAVRDAGARGTRHSPFYAFGVHFNVEPPALDADTVTAFMQAFVCLYDWIAWREEVDLSRRVTPYIDRFPRVFEDKIARPDYQPTMAQLIDDYLADNATRNRALDMLPMFAHVDEDRVKAVVDDPLVKARPAFHYRLSNCCIDEADWSIAQPWSRWLQIEALAANHDARRECMRAFAKDRERLLEPVYSAWREQVQKWLVEV